MTLPNEVPNMPSYFIYRDSPVDQPFDKTALLAFFPPKDSDELFDALRAEFPHLKSHSERMREATIAYLMQERLEEQSPAPTATPLTAETTMTSPWLASFPSVSTDSTFSSPDMLGLATPSFGNSPQVQHPQYATAPTASSSTSPPALEKMTGVFSLSDSTQPKQRVRRKMTEAEKAEYRKRRIVKACDKCSKRKRKCNHNQPEMENLAKPSQKVDKLKPAAHHKKPSVIPMSLSPDPAPDNLGASEPFIQDDWFDFTLLDPMPDVSFDDLLTTDLDQQWGDKPQYSWGQNVDLSVMFGNDQPSQSTPDDRAFDQTLIQQQEPLFDHVQSGANALSFTTGNKKYPVGVQPQQQQTRGGDDLLWADHGIQQHLLERRSLTSNANSGDAIIFDQQFGDSAGGREASSYSGQSAPRKELTRNIKNPKSDDLLHESDGDDRYIHQSESTSKNRRDRQHQANEQNRANVRSVEGSGTKDLLQAATTPEPGRSKAAPDPRAISGGRTIDPSAELFRLRRRVPGSISPSQTQPHALQTLSEADSQVNGGAYLRHDSGNHGTPSLTGLSAILPAMGAEKPVHTRARNRIASDSSDETDRRTDTSMHAESAPVDAAAHSSRPRAHGRSPLREAPTIFKSGTTSEDSSTGFYVARLRDTHRERDHFGRLALAAFAAVVGSLLLFCAARTSSLSLSMVLLALFAPSGSRMQSEKQSPELLHTDEDTESTVFCEGKTNWKDCQKLGGGTEALSGNRPAQWHGWVMTPHSSLRWSVWSVVCA